VLDIKDTRKRWNYLLTLIKRRWEELCGLRVFEMQKMHGLHVHLVTNRFIDVNVVRALAIKAGWGRVHVMRIPAEKAAYLAKYLSKERPECLKGWRLWAGFGNWDWTKVKDVLLDSPFSNIYRGCKEWLHWTGNKEFFARTRFVAFMELQTIMNDWEAGLGPDSKSTVNVVVVVDRNVFQSKPCCQRSKLGIRNLGEWRSAIEALLGVFD